jgi:CheY-like chemotaxis protein
MAKVLVVDDSQTVRKVVERLLVSVGHDVILAENGEAAVTRVEKERPDLVITDVSMPGMSGYDVCKFVKSHALLSGTPVLLIAGIVDAEITRQAQACQADGVLKKPLKGSSLQESVRELLDSARARPAGASDTPAAGATVSGPSDARVRDLEAKLAEEQKRTRHLEDQLRTLRETSASRTKDLYTQLAEERKRAAQLEKQLQALLEERGRGSGSSMRGKT